MAIEKLTFQMDAVGNAVPEMKKVQAQLGSLDKTMMKTTANMNRHVAGMQNVGRANKNLTRNIGMASLQFQDMAVQASMGTDALRIMTMQAPQLASVFGPTGMIVGALIAVGGALAMASMGSKTLSFDFKKFGADAGKAFKPLIDFVRPALDLVKKGFDLLLTGAKIAINGIVNGLNYFAVFVSNVPAIAREAFGRAGKHIELFGANVAMITNDIKFRFLMMFQSMVSDSAAFINETSRQLNNAFNLNLPTDIGAETIGNLNDMLSESNDKFSDLLKKSSSIRKELDKPFESITKMKEELGGITNIDLFSYFDLVAKKAKKKGKEITTVADMIGNNFENAFMQMVRGTKSFSEAFRSMSVEIIAELFRIFVVKKITGFISNAITAAFPSFGATPMKAIGGPVQRGNPYIVGERGPELFVPSRTGSIVPNDGMSGGGQVVVNQTINVSTGVQQTVRTEIKSLMPQIAESAKAAVADAKRRGGSYGRAFA